MSYDNSFMVDVFVGQLKSSLTCARCGYISNTFDPFWEIPLPLKKVRLCLVYVHVHVRGTVYAKKVSDYTVKLQNLKCLL